MNDELWLKAARVMAGCPVNINFREPIIADFDGMAYYINGQANIDIRPGFDDETNLKLLCHEAAHFRLGTASIEGPGQKSGSQKLTDRDKYLRKVHPVTREQETGADRLSSVWVDYAKRHYIEYTGESMLERELKALAGYVSSSIMDRVYSIASMTGMKAAKQFLEIEDWKRAQLKKEK